jgi:putative DNA primase/helicase
MSEQLTERRMNKEVSEVSEVDQAQSTEDQRGKSVLSGKSFHLDGAQPLDVMSFPNSPRKESSPPAATIPNVAHLLDKYNIQVRYDVIKKKILITLPGHIGTVDNHDNVAMAHIISLASLNGIPIGQVPSFVETVADRNMYNPVANWITSKAWDGKDRLLEIYATVTEQQDYPVHLKEILMYKWLLSAVAAVLKRSGFKARGVLTFQGAQGVGKTSWLRSLVPDELLCEMTVKIDHHLDVSNKDTILGAVTHWLVEIGELDSSFRKDVARLKGFLTSDYDKIRRPYARTESEYQRRTVFFASVNQPDFLVDMTGNSRWWTIPVIEINYKHSIDMQQLFAQLVEDYHQGKQWWLDQHEEALLDSCNREHLTVSAIREGLMELVDLQLVGKEGHPAMSPKEVLERIGYIKPTNVQCKECALILRELFGAHKRINGINKWRR